MPRRRRLNVPAVHDARRPDCTEIGPVREQRPHSAPVIRALFTAASRSREFLEDTNRSEMMQCVLELVAIACCIHCTPVECGACDGSHTVRESTTAVPGSFLPQANGSASRSDRLIPRSTTQRLVQVTLGIAGSWVVGGSAYLTAYRTAGDRTVIGDAGISEPDVTRTPGCGCLPEPRSLGG